MKIVMKILRFLFLLLNLLVIDSSSIGIYFIYIEFSTSLVYLGGSLGVFVIFTLFIRFKYKSDNG